MECTDSRNQIFPDGCVDGGKLAPAKQRINIRGKIRKIGFARQKCVKLLKI